MYAFEKTVYIDQFQTQTKLAAILSKSINDASPNQRQYVPAAGRTKIVPDWLKLPVRLYDVWLHLL